MAPHTLPCSNSTVVTLDDLNRYAGILVTFLPIIIRIPLLVPPTEENTQSSEGKSPIAFALYLISSTAEQFLNAYFPIVATFSGIVMLSSDEQ